MQAESQATTVLVCEACGVAHIPHCDPSRLVAVGRSRNGVIVNAWTLDAEFTLTDAQLEHLLSLAWLDGILGHTKQADVWVSPAGYDWHDGNGEHPWGE